MLTLSLWKDMLQYPRTLPLKWLNLYSENSTPTWTFSKASPIFMIIAFMSNHITVVMTRFIIIYVRHKSVDIIYSPSVKWASSTTLGKLWPKNQILPSINLPSILPINPKLNPSKVLLFNSKQFDVVLILVALNTIIISNLFISMIDTSVSCSTSRCKPIFLLRLTNYLLLIMLTNMLLPMKQHSVIKPKFKAMLKTWLFNPIPMVNEPPMIAHLNAQREENHIRISRS